ncbi:DUF4268 domain-containing protein [Salinimicrobium sediminilitoris]|uniref:DUF4268 domain-containing protein n=1 Tax=Salinimicrobium sediminilitoris TaxID=2876715 RepID=UPI001E360237|nr:DUF4268 domain-containing protein [Salinimicrobium sediminilitoris]MCC8360211.1 DUF4268 domain-containing protein [Salinimicrobium sediminilitoris]
MYSREESKKVRQEFWISFGKNYPRKWLLYNTKIKDFSLKFTFTRRLAEVSIDLDATDEILKLYYFEKLQSLQAILKDEYLPDAVLAEAYELDNRKIISRVYVTKNGVNIHDKKDWPIVQAWLAEKMDALERFFLEYRDYIEQ